MQAQKFEMQPQSMALEDKSVVTDWVSSVRFGLASLRSTLCVFSTLIHSHMFSIQLSLGFLYFIQTAQAGIWLCLKVRYLMFSLTAPHG